LFFLSDYPRAPMFIIQNSTGSVNEMKEFALILQLHLICLMAVRSPDAAWIKTERWRVLSDKQKEQFPPLCPDFLMEIKSPSDSRLSQKNKMDEWVASGCRLAWLINPEEELTYVYSDGKVEIIPFKESLSGKEVA
jgi:Uma2 family endonuclease